MCPSWMACGDSLYFQNVSPSPMLNLSGPFDHIKLRRPFKHETAVIRLGGSA
jgi:hypothetical protein